MNAASLVPIGRLFYAIALLGLGTEHFVFREFVLGRAPAWPDGVPGKVLWVSASGVFLILAGLCLVMRRWGREAMLGLAFLVFGWALLRLLPIVATDPLLAGSWTRAGKALTFVGGSLAIAGTLAPIASTRSLARYANATGTFVRVGGICLGCFLFVSGLQHFKFTPFVVTLIPAWIPGDSTWWACAAGVALIAGGLGLLVRRTASVASLTVGLMIFSWFWIVHLPRTFVSVSDGIALFEALAFSGIALVVAGAPYYSVRSVTAGSTDAARRAGAQHARSATPPSNAITAP